MSEVGDREAHHRVHAPGVQAPVEERDRHSLLCGKWAPDGGGRRTGIVHHGFCDAEEHDANAHAGAKEHGEPRVKREVGRLSFRAE